MIRLDYFLSFLAATVFLTAPVTLAQDADREALVERARAMAREALEAADANGDGKVSADEVPGPARLFPRADRDGDGFLMLPEFEAGMIPPEDVVTTALGPPLDDATLVSRLQAGGLVIVFRHGETHRDQTDNIQVRGLVDAGAAERQAAFLDCSRQRVLTDEGREKLRSIAASIQTIGIHVSSVQSSPMCRTRETAWLVFGQLTPNDVLVTARALQARRALAGTVPPEGATAALVTHSGLVTSIVWSPNNPANPGQGVIPEGNAYIVEPLGDGQYNYLARLGPEDWARLADLSQSR